MKSFRTQFMKWFWYNLLTFLVLSIFYVPYQLLWLGLSGTQFIKWFVTAAVFGSLVNIIMRPYVAWVTHWLDRRYPKSPNVQPIIEGLVTEKSTSTYCVKHGNQPIDHWNTCDVVHRNRVELQ